MIVTWPSARALIENAFQFVAPLKSTLVLARGSGNPTFTRADASTCATFTDFEGRVVTALANEARFTGARRVQNLLTYTEAFQNAAWSKSNGGAGSIAVATDAYAAAPDGTTTATRLQLNAGGATGADYSYIRQTPSGASPVVSIWAKSNTGSSQTVGLGVQLSAGSTVVTVTTAWQRFSFSGNASFFDVWALGNKTTQSVDVLVWHPQYESTVGQSNQNPSEYVSVGVLSAPYHGAGVDGVKYFQYQNGNTVASNVVTEAQGATIADSTLKGYLAEGSRTNEINYSNDLTNVIWTAAWSSVTVTNAGVGPDGTNWWKITSTAAGSGSFLRRGPFTTDTATQKTVSAFAKKIDSDYFNLTTFDGTDGNRYWFNIANGTVASTAVVGAGYTGVSAAIQSIGNGWYRCSMTFTRKAVANENVFLSFCDADASLNISISKVNGFGGAQYENGAFASSYIPTTTAAVTRASDQLQYGSSGNMDWAKGTMYAEISITSNRNAAVGTTGVIETNPAPSVPDMILSGSNSLFAGTIDSLGGAYAQALTFPNSKLAGSWENGGNKSMCVNGGTVVTKACTTSAGITTIFIGGANILTTYRLFGTTRNVRIAQVALPDNVLSYLTTP